LFKSVGVAVLGG